MSGVVKYSIGDIGPNVTNAMIIAIIIAKQDLQVIPNRNGPNANRAVWNFTVRDSPADTINVAVWGSHEFVMNTSDSLHVGDIVEIVDARVSFRQGGADDRFRPYVSSAFTLTLDENHSSIQAHPEPQLMKELIQFLHIPVKPITDFLTLADLERKTPASDNFKSRELVDLLVAVGKVCPIRQITQKKTGSLKECRDIYLHDFTPATTLMTLWDKELIERSGKWNPGQTILFLADAHVQWNDFKKRMTVAVGRCTVVTENPISEEAQALRQYAKQTPFMLADKLDLISSTFVNPQSINTVMSIQQVIGLMTEEVACASQREVYALLFCFLSSLDLDGCTQIVSKRCSQCKSLVDDRVGMCEMCACTGAQASLKNSFDMRITLTDHTGTLHGVRLTGETAEKVLGLTVDQFLSLHDDQRTALKWQLLLERCAVRVLLVRQNPADNGPPLVTILDCERADTKEAAARCPAV